MKTNSLLLRLNQIIIFSIAMAFLEGAVVVYLRELYYPNGFKFPLFPDIPYKIFAIEWVREICTIVMLTILGIIAGKSFNTKFAYFIFSFGIWDIFYYVALKIFLNWPESLLTWDLLFLIPVAWIGPVLAPIVCSLTMIAMGLMIIYYEEYINIKLKIELLEYLLIIVGALIIFITFIYDFSSLIIKNGYLNKLTELTTDKSFRNLVNSFIPQKFQWIPFSVGEILIITAIIKIYLKASKRLHI